MNNLWSILMHFIFGPKPVKRKPMITLKEIIKDTPTKDIPKEHLQNLMDLLEVINKIRSAYGKPMVVTSGYRSMKKHLDIYKKKGILDKSKIPMKSRHLSGQAVDIYDPKGVLQSWVNENVKLMEDLGLYLEHFSATPNWVHFQIVPPKSGNRFFYP